MAKFNFEKKKVNVKAVAGIFLLLLAGVTLFAINMFYISQGKVETIVVFNKDISIGTKITSEDVDKKEVGVYGIPKGFIKDKDKVIGKFAKVDLAKGDIAFSKKIGRESLTKAEIAKKGKCVVTIDVTTSESVSTHLVKGDKVGVVSIKQSEGETNSKITNLILDNVTVFAIDNSQGSDATSQKAKDGKSSEALPTLISLILTKEECVNLLNEKANGTLHLIYEGRE